MAPEERNGLYLLLLIPCVLPRLPRPLPLGCPQDKEHTPDRVLPQGAGEGPSCPHHPVAVAPGAEGHSHWAPDPGSYPRPLGGCCWDFCYFSTRSRSKADLFSFSLTLPRTSPVTQNKSDPVYLVSRSAASFQLPMPGLFEANVQARVLPPRAFRSQDCPAATAGSQSMNSFHYQSKPDIWRGNLPKENCTVAFPSQRETMSVLLFVSDYLCPFPSLEAP